MPQVKAQIVVAQAGSTPPVGYTHGSRDRLALETLITCTNLTNSGVQRWQWEVVPLPVHAGADFGVTGQDGPTLGLTVSSERPGDVAVRLTVFGAPLPGSNKANVHTATVLLGLRAPLAGYSGGVPLVHPFESELGGEVTFSPRFGFLARIVEMLWALYLRVLSGGGGGGGSVELVGDVNGTSDDNTVVALLDKPLGPAVNTPSNGQQLAYTTAAGGQYTLTPTPSAAGQFLYWDENGEVPAWGLSDGPFASGHAPRWDGTTWLMGPVDAALLQGKAVDPGLASLSGAARALVTDEDGVLTLGPQPTRAGQGLRFDDSLQAMRQVGGEVSVSLALATGSPLTLTLTDDQVDADVIRLTGDPGGGVTVYLPVRPGRTWQVVSECSDGRRPVLLASVGSTQTHPILVGETRRCWQVGAHLQADDDALVRRWTRSYGFGSAGTVNTGICVIPAGYEVTSCIETRTAATGGTVQTALGEGSGGTDFFALSAASSAAVQRGRKTTELGSAFQQTDLVGLSYSDSDRVIYQQLIVSAPGMTGSTSGVLVMRRLK